MRIKFGFALLAAFITFQSSYAAEVKITSFHYTGTRTRTAELCGIVTGMAAGINIVDITVDSGRNNPGNYTVIPAASGKFCSVVSTESGNADVALRGSVGPIRATMTR